MSPRKTIVKTRSFDAAEYLDSSEGIAAYITEAIESGDPAFVADAFGVIARARDDGGSARSELTDSGIILRFR